MEDVKKKKAVKKKRARENTGNYKMTPEYTPRGAVIIVMKKGRVPDCLKGKYTDFGTAERAIDTYHSARIH